MSAQDSLVRGMLGTLRRELKILWRRKSDSLNPLLFLLMVSSLFPLGVSPAPNVLALLSPGIIWVVALLACLLSTESMFRGDYDDGSLELLLLNPQPMYFHVFMKMLAHWLLTGIPLAVLSPVIALLLNLPTVAIPTLIVSLILGTAPLVFIGGIGAALTVGLRRGGVLLSLIVLPLYVPVLIFGADAVKRASEGAAAPGQLAILAAFFMLSFALAPLAAAGALKISVDS